jgi:radical SAM protein with 4Fe4S-binding SPASM domain
LDGIIEITALCNLKCVHCYISPANKHFKEPELSTAELYRIIDQICDAGCLWLLLTGGEPLLRKDFRDVYIYAKKKGLLLTLFTNGTLINKDYAEFFNEWRPYSTEITLYGMTENTYEKITMVKGSFKRCMEGIERLLEKNVPLKLKTVALNINVQELKGMQKFAESLGLHFRFDPMINSRIDGDKAPLDYRLSPDEVVSLDIADTKRIQAWKEFYIKSLGAPETDRLYTCGAGLNSFHIDAYGNLNMCVIARSQSYNLRRGCFKEGWNSYIKRLRELRFASEPKCLKCNLNAFCGRCPGWSFTENGDGETAVDFLCEIAHKREKALCDIL